ncbi:DUF3375 family protein [Microlunatus sp. GCM10028923]|uniref:DUF3375 family protein n=1 Tax=Microlunatus sp. GCM10028923 TaxID=3273400 RepID=UPI003607FE80
MTDPVSSMLEAQEAMGNATWLLLRQEKWAPIILATLSTVLDRGQHQMPSEEFHLRVSRTFDTLREQAEDFPVPRDDPKAVRSTCKSWVEKGWLLRHTDSAGGEVYRMSAEAREAIRIVQSMTNTRAAVSESQVRVVLDRAQRLALKATSDPVARMHSLRAEIGRLEHELGRHRAELERLEDGGPVDLTDDEDVHNEFLLLRDDIDRLPSDLKRVEESFHALAQELLSAFFSETRPHGEVVAEYLAKARNLAQADRYGRGFQQAKRLLTDSGERQQLQEHIATILTHPFADLYLPPRAQADLRGTVHMIGDSVSAVIEQRRAMTRRLTSFILSNDTQRERELDDALRAVQAALREWSAEHGARATVPLPVGHHAEEGEDPDGPVITAGEVGVAGIATLREKPRQQRVPTSLKALADSDGTAPGDFSADELRAKGGPFYEELAAEIRRATVRGRIAASAALFNRLPDQLRRPVDLLGLLTLATELGALRPGLPVEEYHAVRPDGSTVTYLGPAVTFVDAIEIR